MESRTIDWEKVRCRLAAAEQAVSGGGDPDPDATRRVLEERARAAARAPVRPDEAERLEVLAFSLARENYGIETFHVLEVCKLRNLTPMPCTPPFIAGVMNLGGRILTIVDLGRFFEFPMKGLGELSQVIVIKGGGNEFGLLADSIDGVRSLIPSDFMENLPALADIRRKFLKGIDDRMLAVLDGKRLLEDEGLKVDEEVGDERRWSRSIGSQFSTG